MNKYSIFEIVSIIDESLYSFRYVGEEQHEFARLFDLWRDAEYLEDFFEAHKTDLSSEFWGEIDVLEAILITRKEANRLELEILNVAESGKTDRYSTLSTLFKPLYNNPLKIEHFEKNKLKGKNRPSWLRIYAIRIESNLFVITGGAIKLTPTMNEREHLLKELGKLEAARNFLMDDNNADLEIFELF